MTLSTCVWAARNSTTFWYFRRSAPAIESLYSLKEQEGVEGRNSRSDIPKENGPDICNKRSGSGRVYRADTVIAGIRCVDGGISAGSLPVKFYAVSNDAAQSDPVLSDEFGRGVNHDICSMLNLANQIERPEGIINDQGRPCVWASRL